MLVDVHVAVPDVSIPLDTEIIRGYNITVPVNITLHNTDASIDIETLTGDEYNFIITLYITPTKHSTKIDRVLKRYNQNHY